MSPHSAKRSGRRLGRAAAIVIGSTLMLVAWGAFAFGGVYPWAYGPLAAGSAAVGILGLVSGARPAWATNRLLVIALLAVTGIALIQLLPLPVDWLERVSPGTVAFLRHQDLRFTLGDDPAVETTTTTLRHAISIAPARTILFLQLFGALILLLVGLLRSLSRTGVIRLAQGITVVGSLLAVVGIVQKAILGDNAFTGMRIYGFWKPESLLTTPFGPFVNKNHFAGWMLMAIPIALGLMMAQWHQSERARRSWRDALLWMSEPEGGRMLLYLVCAIVMSLSMLMTGARSALACACVMAICLAIVRGRQTSGRTAVGMLLASLAVIVIGLQFAGRDAKLERFASDSESVGMRVAIWQMSAGVVRDFPVLGTGMNTFGDATIVYQPPGGAMHYNEAHNDYVQLLVEGGLVTFAFVLVALGGSVRTIARRVRSDDDGAQAHWVRVGAAIGLAAIGLQALVEFSLQMPGNAVLFVVLLAMALYVPAQRSGPAL